MKFVTHASIRGHSAKAAVLKVWTTTSEGANIQRTEIALSRQTIAELCEQGQLWMLANPLEICPLGASAQPESGVESGHGSEDNH